ncbi:MAG: hypothetical protein B6I36_03745 [Desulfobacteraceae bacterium 4572_35.1]|nr:MAG: hypothetical protein B6I36_03745 [Desulfobacteraceae bacterium 4572_35.1]
MTTKKSEISSPDSSTSNSRSKNVPLRIIIVLIILTTGIGTAVFLKKTAPKAHKVEPVKRAQLVKVQKCQSTRTQVTIPCFGQVVAARSVNIKSQVSGEIISINPNFDIGARLKIGTELLQIEPRDYQLELARQQAVEKKAAAALELEMGQQDIAHQEWQIYQNSGAPMPPSAQLALRQPYLHQAQAEYMAAQAAVEKAQLSLQRTIITAPFECLVLDKQVDLGAQLSAQTTVSSIVATDVFWVEVVVPIDQLSWLDLPDVNSTSGSSANIILQGRKHQRKGKIIRLLGNLATGSRMARLLIAIPDPLDLQRPLKQRQPLLLGDYVEVNLLGHTLENIISIPRSALHNGNQVWIASTDNTLSVRNVNIVWKDRQRVFIDRGIQQDEAIILSDLTTAVDGMAVRIAQATESH